MDTIFYGIIIVLGSLFGLYITFHMDEIYEEKDNHWDDQYFDDEDA
jgi:hypothetical protein